MAGAGDLPPANDHHRAARVRFPASQLIAARIAGRGEPIHQRPGAPTIPTPS